MARLSDADRKAGLGRTASLISPPLIRLDPFKYRSGRTQAARESRLPGNQDLPHCVVHCRSDRRSPSLPESI